MNPSNLSRRELLQALSAMSLSAALPLSAQAKPADDNRILVVVELTGANDGFNTLVPYGDDNYYKLRPTLGIRANKLRKIDDMHGFSPGMAGLARVPGVRRWIPALAGMTRQIGAHCALNPR